MAKDEFDLGNILGGLKSSVDSLKETMTQHHVAFNVKLDMLVKENGAIDKKADRAIDQIDDVNKEVSFLKNIVEQTSQKVESLEESKKKILWTMGGVSIGGSIAGTKIANFIGGLFQ